MAGESVFCGDLYNAILTPTVDIFALFGTRRADELVSEARGFTESLSDLVENKIWSHSLAEVSSDNLMYLNSHESFLT